MKMIVVTLAASVLLIGCASTPAPTTGQANYIASSVTPRRRSVTTHSAEAQCPCAAAFPVNPSLVAISSE